VKQGRSIAFSERLTLDATLEVLGHRIEVRSVVDEGSLFSIYAPVAAASES